MLPGVGHLLGGELEGEGKATQCIATSVSGEVESVSVEWISSWERCAYLLVKLRPVNGRIGKEVNLIGANVKSLGGFSNFRYLS